MNNLVKQKNDVSAKKDLPLSNFSYPVTIKLNPLISLLAIASYTGLIIFISISFLAGEKVSKEDTISLYEGMKKEILAEIKKNKAVQKTTHVKVDSSRLNNNFEKLRIELIAEVNKINNKYIDIVERNKNKYSNIIKNLPTREPASINANSKVLQYNAVNRKLVNFKHQKSFKRKKEKLKHLESLAIAKLDLTKEEDIERLKKIQDETEMALYELKTRQNEQQREFRVNKYIVLND